MIGLHAAIGAASPLLAQAQTRVPVHGGMASPGSGEMGGGLLMAAAGLIPIIGLAAIAAIIVWAARRGEPDGGDVPPSRPPNTDRG